MHTSENQSVCTNKAKHLISACTTKLSYDRLTIANKQLLTPLFTFVLNLNADLLQFRLLQIKSTIRWRFKSSSYIHYALPKADTCLRQIWVDVLHITGPTHCHVGFFFQLLYVLPSCFAVHCWIKLVVCCANILCRFYCITKQLSSCLAFHGL